jgi:hypothetical protein
MRLDVDERSVVEIKNDLLRGSARRFARALEQQRIEVVHLD